MAQLNVNPTRMELMTLKNKLSTARRGHKLLKDKCDEIIRQFMELVRENKRLRIEVEKELSEAMKYMSAARGSVSSSVIDTALLMPRSKISVDVGERSIMSVKVPIYKEVSVCSDDSVNSYGYAFTSSDMDEAVAKIKNVMSMLIKLAETEKTCQLLADEAEKTRRRVNALEHVMIPDYEDTIKYIMMKLDENERSTTIRLMKVKDMMIEKARK